MLVIARITNGANAAVGRGYDRKPMGASKIVQVAVIALMLVAVIVKLVAQRRQGARAIVIRGPRNHLLRTPDGHYDLVISEPSNPWLSGVSNLFTREFFALGKRKLAPGGIWAQWLHLYGMQPDDLKSLLGTFASMYESVSLFRIGDTSIVLIGSDGKLDLHVLEIDAYVASHEGVIDDLNRIGLQRAEDVLGLFQFDRSVLIELVGNAGPNIM